jgi:hypothetical protein
MHKESKAKQSKEKQSKAKQSNAKQSKAKQSKRRRKTKRNDFPLGGGIGQAGLAPPNLRYMPKSKGPISKARKPASQ